MMNFTKSLATAAVVCGLAMSAPGGATAAGLNGLGGLKSTVPQSQIVQVRRGARIGLGILGVAAATAIIAGAARADRRHGYYEDGDRCGYLEYKCSQGHGWACRRYDYRCID